MLQPTLPRVINSHTNPRPHWLQFVAGPTRRALREAYHLPKDPACLANCGNDSGVLNTDCW